MAKPMVVEIPHELGQAEAKRRLEEGTDKARVFLQKSGVTIDTLAWTGDRLDFSVSSLGQKVGGQIDVNAETVRVEVRLPLLLHFIAERVQKAIGKEGNLLLTKK